MSPQSNVFLQRFSRQCSLCIGALPRRRGAQHGGKGSSSNVYFQLISFPPGKTQTIGRGSLTSRRNCTQGFQIGSNFQFFPPSLRPMIKAFDKLFPSAQYIIFQGTTLTMPRSGLGSRRRSRPSMRRWWRGSSRRRFKPNQRKKPGVESEK